MALSPGSTATPGVGLGRGAEHPCLVQGKLGGDRRIDGREFYAERTDFRQQDCSGFVREEVLPLLGRASTSSTLNCQTHGKPRVWGNSQERSHFTP